MASTSDIRAVVARKLAPAAIFLGCMLASYMVVGSWRVSSPGPAGAEARASDEPPQNPFASANGTHLVAFVIASSTCGWSSLQSTMDAIGRIRETMRAVHGSSYAQVTVVGVVLDRDLEAGLRFVSELDKGKPDGAFDQIVVGGSWLNEQLVRVVWREGIARATTPQVIVVERPVNTLSYLSAATIGVESDQLVLNPTGSAEIVQWVNLGVPLDYAPYGDLSSD